MKRVAAYCRVSTDKTDQIGSFESQKRYFREYIEQNADLELYRIYADEGITGTNVKNRVSFKNMIEDAKNGKFDLILTKEISRFARNLLDSIYYTRELKRYGVSVFFINDRIDTMEPDAELRLAILATIAQEESRRTSERVKWGQTRRMEAGIVFGRSMLGYDVKNGEMTVNEEGAEIVRAIFRMYTEDKMGFAAIARALDENGIPPMRAQKWNGTVVMRILKNEKYVGDLVQKKTYTPDYLSHEKKYNRGAEEMIVIRDHHTPIIPREVFEKAAMMLSGQMRKNGLTEKSFADIMKSKNTEKGRSFMTSKVYFTREITPEAVLKLYEMLNTKLEGKVAVKLHSGEVGNQNFLRPDFFKPIMEAVKGTVVECNTAYEGKRNTTEKHLETLKEHGWSEYYPVDLLDGEGEDIVLDIPNGAVIKKNYKNYIGNHADRYDSMLVLSHFKGHPMGGYGGALKQLSIGVASSFGKAYIHGAGEPEKIWTADHDSFLRSMADAAGSVIEFYRGKLAYVNVMKNLSVDCDCCAVAEDPCMKDIGILASLDPVALDRACLDLVYASDDPGRDHLIKRIETRNGALTVDAAAELGYGSKEYELIEI